MREIKRILVIEDDLSLQVLIKRSLKKGEIEIQTAYSGKEAIEKIKTEMSFDLLLIDYRLADMTGKEIIEELNHDGIIVPFIFMTGYGDERIAIEIMKMGAKDYIIKDANFTDKIIASVQNILNQSKLEKELLETQKALYEREKEFRQLYENAIIGIYRSTPDGKVLLGNPAVLRMFGVNSIDELTILIQKSLRLKNANEQNIFIEELEKKGEIIGYETMFYKLNGTKFYGRETVKLIKNNDGEIKYYEGWIEDITDQVATREREIMHFSDIEFLSKAALKFSELTENENIFEFIGFSLKSFLQQCVIIVYSIDKKTDKAKIETILGNSPIYNHFIDLLQIKQHQILYRIEWRKYEVFSSTSLEEFKPGFEHVLLKEVPTQNWEKAKELFADNCAYGMGFSYMGQVFGGAFILVPYNEKIKNKDVLDTFAHQASIAIQKRVAEDDLKKSAQMYRSTYENAANLIITVDVDGKIIDCNKLSNQVLGYEVNELKNKNITFLIDEDEIEMFRNNLREVLVKGATYNNEFKMIRKDGKRIDTSVNASGFEDIQNRTIVINCIIDNITARKRDELLRSIIINIANAIYPGIDLLLLFRVIKMEVNRLLDTEYLSLTLQQGEDHILLITYDNGEVKSNKMTISENPLALKVCSEQKTIHLNHDAIKELIGNSPMPFDKPVPLSWLSIPLITEDEFLGSINLYNYSSSVYKEEDVLTMEFIANQIAITVHRIWLDEKIRKLSQSVEQSPISVIITNIEGTIEYVNKNFTKVTGFEAEEVLNKEARVLELNEQIWEKLCVGVAWKGEVQSERKNGELYWEDVNVSPMFDKSNRITHFITVTEDITKRKESEHEIIKVKALLEASEKYGKIGGWEIERTNHAITFTPEIAHIFDVDFIKLTDFDSILKFFSEKNANQIKQAINDAFMMGAQYDLELEVTTASDNKKWVHIIGIPISDDNNQINLISGTIQDITKRKKAEIALVQNEANLSSLIENTKDTIWSVDRNLNIITINSNKIKEYYKQYKTILYPGEYILKNKPPQIEEKWKKIYAEALEGKTQNFEEIVEIGHKEIYRDYTLTPIMLDDFTIVGVSCFAKDITHIKQVEFEIKKLNEELEERVKTRTKELEIANKNIADAMKTAESANVAKSEFLANMSHEIRTPMNAIIGFSDLLSKIIKDPLAENYLESIRSSSNNLLKLINDILDLSKIEAGKLEIQYEYIETNKFFNEIALLFDHKTKENGIDFIVNISQDLPNSIFIDEIRLRQILINLLGNSIKFTSKGYIKLEVLSKAKTKKINNQDVIDLTITVEDTGIGIKKDFQKKIFESFTQQEGQSIKKYGGTGLGLSISNHLIQLMGGNIKVESEVGKGSTFILNFPNVAISSNFEAKPEKQIIDVDLIEFSPAKIVVADDVEYNRSYIKGILRETPIEFFEAENGAVAYELSEKHLPQVIITDIKMPELDGFQLLKKLKSNPNTSEIPVIAVSAAAMKKEQDQIKESGFSGYLVKPFKINELYDELIKFLPYNLNEKTVIEVESVVEKIKLNKQQANEIIISLKGELYKKWQEFENQQPMYEVEIFANKLMELGNLYTYTPLIDYGNNLIEAVTGFDISSLLRLLKNYPKIITNLEQSWV